MASTIISLDDPVRARLVESLNRPGSNITGISAMNLELGSKWVGLLHEFLLAAKRIAILVNIENADAARLMITDTQEAAFSMGLQTDLPSKIHRARWDLNGVRLYR